MATTKKHTAPEAVQAPACALFGEDAAKIVAQQGLAMVAHSLRSTLTLMTELNKAGGDWGDLENDTSLLLELGMEQVQRLRDNPPEALEDFSHQWFRIASMVRLLAQNYPDKTSILFRFLDAARREFEVLPDLWETVVIEGESHQQEGGAA